MARDDTTDAASGATADGSEALRAAARRVARDVLAPRAAEVDRSEAYPWDNVEAMRAAGLLGMTLPRDLGGRGASLATAVRVIEEVAQACTTSARIVVETNMGAVGAILAHGTEAQRRRAAELVLAGDKPAICITEPQAGSAATEMTTRAVRHGDRWVLNGHKHWITGAGVSRLHLIFARAIEDGRERGIAGFLAVRGEDAGLEIGAREPAMGVRGIPEGEVILNDLELPLDRAVIPADGLERGFAQLMTAYNGQRVGAAAVALGVATGAFEHARGYLVERAQFGRPIGEFQGLQWMLADMSIQLEAARALVRKAAGSAGDGPAGSGFPDMVQAAQAKVLASETAVKVTNDALQLFGAAGYSRNNPLERMVRDARMFTIGGGTAQVLRTLVGSQLLGLKAPQTREGQAALAQPAPARQAAE